MQTRRWVNQSQPQTLVIATFLLYIRAAFALLGIEAYYAALTDTRGGLTLIRLVLIGGGAAAAYGIANERDWAYKLGVAIAALPLVAQLVYCVRVGISPLQLPIIGLMFDIALFALLVHPMSRDYERIWFSKKPKGPRRL